MEDRSCRLRIAVVALLSIIPMSASAFDFRGIDLGNSCRQAADRESSMGSRPHRDVQEMIQRGGLIFEGEYFAGELSKFLYSCDPQTGLVKLYSISTTTPTEVRARRAYDSAKADAVSRLGDPDASSETPEGEEVLRRLRAKDLTWNLAFSTWNSKDGKQVTLVLEKRPADDGWNVVIVVSVARSH